MNNEASVEDLRVQTDAETVGEYDGFRLEADLSTGTDMVRYHPPDIYVVDTSRETVVEQRPGEDLSPDTDLTWEMGFVGIPEPTRATTVLVHMGGAVDTFTLEAGR